MNEAHPGAGLTFGYIGNVERQEDNRLWMIFSDIPNGYDANGPKTWTWGAWETDFIYQMARSMARGVFKTALEKQLEAVA